MTVCHWIVGSKVHRERERTLAASRFFLLLGGFFSLLGYHINNLLAAVNATCDASAVPQSLSAAISATRKALRLERMM